MGYASTYATTQKQAENNHLSASYTVVQFPGKGLEESSVGIDSKWRNDTVAFRACSGLAELSVSIPRQLEMQLSYL